MADPNADTAELEDRHVELITIYGRDFQKFSIERTIHLVPVDEEETSRLEAQHQVLDLVFDGKLFFPPVSKPRNVLDCGYGAGSWALEVAERDPSCTVIGVDISPHMRPDDMPDNLILQLDDLNRSFNFHANHFDFVHSRMVGSGIDRNRWPSYFQDIKKVLKPGGWVQVVECYYMCQSDNGSITDNHAIRQWSNNYLRAIEVRKDPRAPLRLHTLLSNAGFTAIETNMIPLPLCGWGNDARQRRIGGANRQNIRQLLNTFAIFPFTRSLGMPINTVNNLVNRASADAANTSLKPYFPLYIGIGKKPGG